VGCVDGRQDNNESDIGSLIDNTQLMNIMCDNTTNSVQIVFHTDCGYIVTALILHRLFRAMKLSINPDDDITLRRVDLFIKTLMTKPWVRRDHRLFEELMTRLDLSKVSTDEDEKKNIRDLLHNLITDSSGTLRYATSHMMDRGLFEVSDHGLPQMTAYKNVEKTLEKHGITDINEEILKVIVVEELTRLDRDFKTKFIQTKSSVIESKRIDNCVPSIEWMVEDFFTGRYYKFPPKKIAEQTKEQILSTARIDAITEKTFDIAARIKSSISI